MNGTNSEVKKLFVQLLAVIVGLCFCISSYGQVECSAIQVERSMLDAKAQYLGVIRAGAHSFTSRCTRPQVIRDIQMEACKIGADVFIITEEKVPGLWRSCFTIEAGAYRSPRAHVKSLDIEDLRKLAATGNTEAQHSLGLRFLEGDGTQIDLIEAYAWFNLAASQNIARSVSQRDRIEAKLSPEELAEAQERSVQIWLGYYRIGAHRGARP
jgi:hypothetical protein